MKDRCILCHRKLKDQLSKSRGLGPTCWSKLKRLDKAEKKKRKERLEAKKLKEQLIKGQISLFDKESEKHE